MGAMDEPRALGSSAADETVGGFVCDFCGASVSRVRRIALDRDYERLQTPHNVQYACEACSAEKEKRRLSDTRG